jgi:hypothetical protein
MKDPVRRAERYHKIADEFIELASGASTPFLRAYYERVAQQYRDHANGELQPVEQRGAAARDPTTS